MTYFCAPLQHCVWSVITGLITHCRQLVCSELCTSAQHATSLSQAGAATPTVEREQLIGHARHENSVDDLT